jgi:hypothetical protein
MDEYLLTPEEIDSIKLSDFPTDKNGIYRAVAEAQLAKVLPELKAGAELTAKLSDRIMELENNVLTIREEVRKEESNRIRRELLKYNETGWEDENGHKCHKAILLNQKEWSRIFNLDIEGK